MKKYILIITTVISLFLLSNTTLADEKICTCTKTETGLSVSLKGLSEEECKKMTNNIWLEKGNVSTCTLQDGTTCDRSKLNITFVQGTISCDYK